MSRSAALNLAILVESFAGVFVAGVLSLGAYYQHSIPCGASHGCDAIANHWTSHALGIPNAYIGLAAYLALAGLAVARILKPALSSKMFAAGLAISLVGTLLSLILTYVGLKVVHATCAWCLTSCGLMAALLATHLAWRKIGFFEHTLKLHSSTAGALTILVAGALMWQRGSMLQYGGSTGTFALSDERPLSLFIPSDAHITGRSDAPLTVVEFGDLLCPACQSEYGELKKFESLHRGKVRIVFRHFPMLSLPGHAQSGPAAVAAEIAGEKDLFWKFLDKIYEHQLEDLTDPSPILEIGKSLGLDPKLVRKRMMNEADPAFQRVLRDIESGTKLGVTRTPSFFIVAGGIVRASSLRSLDEDLARPEYARLL